MLVPIEKEPKMSVQEAIEGIKALRKRLNLNLSQREIKKMIEKGRDRKLLAAAKLSGWTATNPERRPSRYLGFP